MSELKIKDQTAQQNSWTRQEKKEKMRSYEATEFGRKYIVFEKKTKRGKWVRSGRIQIG